MWYLAFRLVVSEVSYFRSSTSLSRAPQSFDLGSSIDRVRDSLCVVCGSTQTRTIEQFFQGQRRQRAIICPAAEAIVKAIVKAKARKDRVA